MAVKNEKSQTAPAVLPAIVFLIIGFVFLWLSGLTFSRTDHLAKVCTEETEGKIVEIIQKIVTSRTGSVRTTRMEYYPRVRFTRGGKIYTVTSGMTVPKDKYKRGQKVTFMINPDDPSELYLDGQLNTYSAVGWLILGFSAVSFLVAAILFRKCRLYNIGHRQPKQETDWIQEQIDRENFTNR